MLVLTRKVEQAIVIQGNILITVLGVERDRVKIGIAAPEDISVLRQELIYPEKNGGLPKGPSEESDPPTQPRASKA
jgi:carbon storage regulator